MPSQPNAASIEAQLQSELYHVSLHHQEKSVQMLEGWWFKRVLHELVHPDSGIPRAEIDAQITEIQESLKPDSLPIDGELDALMVALDQLPAFSDWAAAGFKDTLLRWSIKPEVVDGYEKEVQPRVQA